MPDYLPLARLRTVPWSALGEGGDLTAELAAVLSDETAERVVDRALRARRALTADGRRAVAEAIFGVAVWRLRIAHHLGHEALAANAKETLGVFLRDLAGFSTDAAAAVAGVIPPPRRPPPDDFSTFHSIPSWLTLLIRRDFGDEADAFAAALNLPGPIAFRVNSLRVTRDALEARLSTLGVLVRKSPLSPHGLVVEGARPNVFGIEPYREGLFEVQDEGSQLLAALVDAHPGMSVLDFCAGAGGKSLAIAGQLQDVGALHVHDPDREKLVRLPGRLARAGNVPLRVHYDAPPSNLKVDRVLVDAPCSELGALRRGPDRRFHLRPETVAEHAALQRTILERAAGHVATGGRLVYGTCTFTREENEDVAFAFERAHPEFERISPEPRLVPPDTVSDGFFKTAPHRHGADAFFGAVFRRRR